MNDLDTSQKYCSDLVARRDEDRWLSAQYAGEALRARLIARYALHEEIRQIPDAVSEPPLGEIRCQWWRDALDEILGGAEPRAHPVVSFAAASGAIDADYRRSLESAIEARARLLYDPAFRSAEELFAWLERAEGYIVYGHFTNGAFDDGEIGALVRAEVAFAFHRYRSMLGEPFRSSAAAAASDAIRAARGVLTKASADVAGSFLHLSLRPPHERKSPTPFTPLAKRLRLFTAMATGAY